MIFKWMTTDNSLLSDAAVPFQPPTGIFMTDLSAIMSSKESGMFGGDAWCCAMDASSCDAAPSGGFNGWASHSTGGYAYDPYPRSLRHYMLEHIGDDE